MKTKMLLLASVFTLGLASCSNSDDLGVDTSKHIDGDLKLRVEISEVTRAVDEAANQGDKSSLQTIDVYLLSSTGVHSSYTLVGADIDALTGAGFTLQKVNGNVEKIGRASCRERV